VAVDYAAEATFNN